VADGQNNQNSGGRRRRYRNNRGGGGGGGNTHAGPPGQGLNRPQSQQNPDHRREPQQNNQGGGNRSRRPSGRVLTSNQVLVKYDNLLEQHLITRRKYYEYFNRVDDRNLRRLENNFFDSIEHLRKFEATLEPWQREVLEKRKTERYKLDLTYSSNRELPQDAYKGEVPTKDFEDPHFKDSQKEAFEEYKEDDEESVGTFEDYLKLKGLN
jgi:hypothetical protein